MKQSYQQNGFVILENFISPLMVESLRARAYSLSHEIQGNLHPIIHPQHKHHWNIEELEATTRSYCCYWETPCDPATRLLKISHALHQLDPCFYDFSRSDKISQLAQSLGLAHPNIVQSMLHFKPSYSCSEIDWHQDATYITTTPCSTVGLWLALEDATLENGCLRVIPSSHHQGLCSQMIRSSSGELSFRKLQERTWLSKEAVDLPVPAGTLIALHGLLAHSSKANESSHSRLSLTFHLFDLDSEYSDQNWLPINFASRLTRLQSFGGCCDINKKE